MLDKGATCRTWGDCYGYYLLCIGIADVMVDIDMKSHDIVPLIPILKGAGIELIELSRNDNLISVIAFKSEITEEIKSYSDKWSGRRDSNPRHPPWQGGALPTELRPH